MLRSMSLITYYQVSNEFLYDLISHGSFDPEDARAVRIPWRRLVVGKEWTKWGRFAARRKQPSASSALVLMRAGVSGEVYL